MAKFRYLVNFRSLTLYCFCFNDVILVIKGKNQFYYILWIRIVNNGKSVPLFCNNVYVLYKLSLVRLSCIQHIYKHVRFEKLFVKD